MEKKVFALMLTTGQFKSLQEQGPGSEAWWERLADITEVDPIWLKENMGPFEMCHEVPFKVFKQMSIEHSIEEKTSDACSNCIIMVHPVPQKDSGVFTKVYGFEWSTEIAPGGGTVTA